MSVGLLERPLFIGLLWALATGEYEVSLKIAIFFELAWLDMIPAGTYIPPHLGAAMFTALALATHHGLLEPGPLSLVIAAGIPMAWLGTRLEAYLRSAQGRCHQRAMFWAQESQAPFPERMIHQALLWSFLASWAFFFVSVLLLNMLIGQVVGVLGPLLAEVHVDWPHLWIAASFGGLLSLRLRRAYGVFFSGAGLLGLALLLGLF